jgi:prevent-host-death family protein
MKNVTAREANQSFSRLLGEAEAGEEIVITRHGKPVAVLRPYRALLGMAERQAAVQRAIRLMESAPTIGIPGAASREEIYDERLGELAHGRTSKAG